MGRPFLFLLLLTLLGLGGEIARRHEPSWLWQDPLVHPFGADPEEAAPEAAIDAEVPPTPSDPLDLNRADLTGLQRLPGVGPVLAARIAAHRDSLGGLRELSQLRVVKGVGEKRLERWAPLVVFR